MEKAWKNRENHAKTWKKTWKAMAKTWLKRFQKTIILGFAVTVLYKDLIEGLNFKLVLGSRAPADPCGCHFIPEKGRANPAKKASVFLRVYDSLCEVRCSTTLFLLFYVSFICILAYFGLYGKAMDNLWIIYG